MRHIAAVMRRMMWCEQGVCSASQDHIARHAPRVAPPAPAVWYALARIYRAWIGGVRVDARRAPEPSPVRAGRGLGRPGETRRALVAGTGWCGRASCVGGEDGGGERAARARHGDRPAGAEGPPSGGGP